MPPWNCLPLRRHFVGCDRRSLDGAAAYGLRTIAFNCQEEVEADARLDSFADIVELVEQWSNPGSLEAQPMIAPLPQPPVKPRRRTALSAARQAVAEALLDGDDHGGRRRLSICQMAELVRRRRAPGGDGPLFLSISWSFDAN